MVTAALRRQFGEVDSPLQVPFGESGSLPRRGLEGGYRVRFSCPYLAGEVELTEEREKHIGDRHPELLPEFRDRIRVALAEPHEVRRSARSAQVVS